MEHIISKTTRGGKILRIVLAALMCLSVFQVAALAAPQKAYAVTVPNIGDKAWGNCHIDDSWMSGSQSYFNTSGFSGDLAGAVAVGDIVCLDHTAAEPNHTDASYEATVSAVNVSAGWVEYSVYITPPGVTDGVTRDEFGRLTGYQHIGGTYRIEKDFVGWLDLDKDSADTSITDNNDCYSLSGAVYGIFASFADAQARTGAVGSLTTDANGYAKSGDLEPKTFYVREITPPQGYALDENIYSTTVAASSTVRVNGNKVLDTPQADPIGALLGKFDGEKTHDAANLPQGSASLALAQYEIKYYSGYHSTTDTSWTQSATPVRSWVMQTDEGGRVDLRAGDSTFVTKDGVSHPYKVSGDDFYHAPGAGIITMPLGTVTLQEIKAPTGYLLPSPNPLYASQITPTGSLGSVDTYNMPTTPEPVIRGGVAIDKRDIESMLDTPLGSASLDGATFAITSQNDNTVRVDGAFYTKGEVVKYIQSSGGVATTQADTLPFGHYTLHETAVGAGYLLSGETRSFDIVEDGKIVHLRGAAGIANQVKRGDIEFIKTSEADMSRLAKVPFRLTSQTTGESHILVTDANGYASTENSWNAHSLRTNGNDSATEDTYNAETGIWFGLTTENTTVEVDDTLAALPYDAYTLTELACAANQGLQLLTISDITIARDKVTVDLGTLDDSLKDTLYITTVARDGIDLDKIAFADPETTLVDKVNYVNAAPNTTYTLKGELMDKATGQPVVIEGKAVVAEKTFTTSSPNGFVNMDFVFDARALGGHDVVVFETLYRNDTIIAEHKDLNDTDQTIKIVSPEITTTAKDGIDGDKTIALDTNISIIDTLAYKNLIVGKSYVVTGKLMDKATGQALLVEGKEVVGTTTFVPDTPNGSVDVVFSLDGTGLDGKTLVVFETLTKDGIEIASHEDIADIGQSVVCAAPTIKTMARDDVDGDKNVVCDKQAIVIDALTYKNLIVGKSYVVTGKLMDKATGQALLVEGKEVVGTTTFIPKTSDGSVEVAFNFDTSALADKELVVFETLTKDKLTVVTHSDIADSDQTVKIVASKISTKASDKTDGDANIIAGKDGAIVDVLSYTNLIPGKEYIVRGILMDKASGKELLVGDKQVSAEKRFTPNASSGTIELEFFFDATRLEGSTVVVFEHLFKDGVEVAAHTDINDAAQSVNIIKAPEGSVFDKTGVQVSGVLAVIFLLIGSSLGLLVYDMQRRKAALSEKPAEDTQDKE